MRANWAVLTANGERPKPSAAVQATAGPALRRSQRKSSAVVAAMPSAEERRAAAREWPNRRRLPAMIQVWASARV